MQRGFIKPYIKEDHCDFKESKADSDAVIDAGNRFLISMCKLPDKKSTPLNKLKHLLYL